MATFRKHVNAYYINKENIFTDELKRKLEEAAENTTSHGISHMLRTHNIFLRVMWGLFFIASLTYCIYVISKSFIQYRQYDTTTSIDYVQETPAQFPAVTICNKNPIKLDENNESLVYFTKQFDIKNCLLQYANSTNYSEAIEGKKTCYNVTSIYALLNRKMDKTRRYIANDENITNENRSNLGFDLASDMLMSCEYNGVSCTAQNFTKFWSNLYGNCYTFNDGLNQPILQTNKVGPSFGLMIEMFVISPYTQSIGIASYGLELMIHNQSTIPSTLTQSVSVATGFETYFGIKRTFRSKLDSPYSDCLKTLKPFSAYSKKLFDYFSQSNISYYNQEICYNFCYQDLLVDQCNCSDIITNSIRGTKYCATDIEINCQNDFEASFSQSNIEEYCNSACPIECDSISYDIIKNEDSYPSDAYVGALFDDNTVRYFYPDQNKTSNIEFARLASLKLVVNYDELTYRLVSESPQTTVEELFGNTGGQLGLFIGISLLSLIEVIQLVVEICIVFYKFKLKQRNSLKQNPVLPFKHTSIILPLNVNQLPITTPYNRS